MNRVHQSSLLSLTLAAALGCTAAQAGECQITSFALKRMCFNQAETDYWETLSFCFNQDQTSLNECRSEARATFFEESAFCDEQTEARNDLCEATDDGPYVPAIDPEQFLSPDEAAADPNPFFPLIIGRQYTYVGIEETVVVTITEDTREIRGIECTAVRDTVTDEEGNVVEDTIDWYAQDQMGNVWYFGELSQNYEDGYLENLDGSFTADDEAQPGIIMPAAPVVGQVFRQEFKPGEAEDAGEVLALNGSASTPAADCGSGCLVTRDFTPLEPDHLETKYYAPGIGFILEVDDETGERLELVDLQDPS
ncbi:MAG: hypothetical protein KDI71_15655 [Xanthomonadales bacterium]|nr:hypothetical protein [Xanthomonadales bacterium]